jgi:molybdopterin molybdotransferase
VIRYADALDVVRTSARGVTLATETLPLSAARGRVLAADVHAASDIPRFANSAMDGFAVRAAATPGRFAIAQRLFAGDEAGAEYVDTARAVEIMTGAPLPPGADAIARVEDVRVTADAEGRRSVEVPLAVASGTSVRAAGEDYRAGDVVARAGTRLTPEALLALAQAGTGAVRVHARPRVAIVPTGRELAEPGEPLASRAMVWSSSPVYLAAALEDAGCDVVVLPLVRDDVAEFAAALTRARDAHLVLTTGAVSAGAHDFVPDALRARGARVLFHKLAARPAKPVLFAELDAQRVFGLPGNPISAAVAWRFLVWPALAAMLGIAPEIPRRARLTAEVRKPAGLRCFYKALLRGDTVTVTAGQGSHLVRPLAECDAWAVLEEDTACVAAGTEVEVYALQPGAVSLR